VFCRHVAGELGHRRSTLVLGELTPLLGEVLELLLRAVQLFVTYAAVDLLQSVPVVLATPLHQLQRQWCGEHKRQSNRGKAHHYLRTYLRSSARCFNPLVSATATEDELDTRFQLRRIAWARGLALTWHVLNPIANRFQLGCTRPLTSPRRHVVGLQHLPQHAFLQVTGHDRRPQFSAFENGLHGP